MIYVENQEEIDRGIRKCLNGSLGIACITNPHLRRMAASFCQAERLGYTREQWCLRYEEIWMWHDFPQCRGGCRQRKYDATKPDCQACYIVAEDKLIEQLVSGWDYPYNRWMPTGSYAVHHGQSDLFNQAEVC